MSGIPKGYKLTEVGVIPEDWDTPYLGECVKFRTGPFGSALHKSDYTDDGIPVVNPMHIIDGRIEPTRSMTITAGAVKNLIDFCIKAGDIVLGRRGDMGRCAVVQPHQVGWLCGTGSMIVRCEENSDAHFVQRLLSSPPVIAAIEETSVGTTMINLNQGALAGLRIQLPPLPEQHVIATALGDADALIERLERLIAKKRQIKQGAMQELLTGQRRLPGFSGAWEVKRLGEIGRFRGGSGFPLVHQGKQLGAYPFFKVSDLNNVGNETFMLFANNYIDEVVREGLGAIAIPAKAIVFAKVGAAVFLERKRILGQPSCIDNNMAAYILSDNQRVDYRFVHLCFLKFKLGSLVSTTALPSLSGNVLSAIEFAFPPTIDEQSAIAGVLSDMDAEIEALEARLAKARLVKQGMMQELLTGRVRLV